MEKNINIEVLLKLNSAINNTRMLLNSDEPHTDHFFYESILHNQIIMTFAIMKIFEKVVMKIKDIEVKQ